VTDAPRLSSLLFAASVFLNVTLWAFILAMCVSTFVYSNEGESAEGFGLLWYFSVPVWAVASLAGIPAFRWFRAAQSGAAAALRYAAVVLSVFAVAPVVWAAWGWVR